MSFGVTPFGSSEIVLPITLIILTFCAQTVNVHLQQILKLFLGLSVHFSLIIAHKEKILSKFM